MSNTATVQPTGWPLSYFWLTLSILLNLTGIASIVDGMVEWAGFFQNIVELYRETVRAPLAELVATVWPAGWPQIPGWCFDILIIWSAFFIAKNIANTRIFGRSIIGYRFSKHSPPVALLYCLWEFLATPFKTIAIALQANNPHRRPSAEMLIGRTILLDNSYGERRPFLAALSGDYVGQHPRFGPTRVSRVEYYRLAALYLAFLVGAFVVLLFINYQLLHR